MFYSIFWLDIDQIRQHNVDGMHGKFNELKSLQNFFFPSSMQQDQWRKLFWITQYIDYNKIVICKNHPLKTNMNSAINGSQLAKMKKSIFDMSLP